jgi:hypothetical protein
MTSTSSSDKKQKWKTGGPFEWLSFERAFEDTLTQKELESFEEINRPTIERLRARNAETELNQYIIKRLNHHAKTRSWKSKNMSKTNHFYHMYGRILSFLAT